MGLRNVARAARSEGVYQLAEADAEWAPPRRAPLRAPNEAAGGHGAGGQSSSDGVTAGATRFSGNGAVDGGGCRLPGRQT